MSEDTLVNTGVVVWPSEDSAWAAVQRMQIKLHQWAQADGLRRFGDLFNLVYDPAFLVHAFEVVARNDGARTAGVDGVTVTRIKTRNRVEAFLSHVQDQLRTGVFEPVEVRQVFIPKGNSGKVRRLGIPTVTDRVVQASLKLVLEPIFEADFKPCSYGFRPKRRAHDAIAEIQYLTSRTYEWVMEADIRACFDEIDHTALMGLVRNRIKDKRVNALVKAFLKAGVMTATGDREDSVTGTPQGGILSPLLANIALSVLDEHFERQWHRDMSPRWTRQKRTRVGMGNWRLIRYADDFVLVVAGERHHAEALRDEAATVLAQVGLRLAEEKTRTVHIDEGFDFLGFHIHRRRKRGTNKQYVYTTPSAKAIAAMKATVKDRTRRHTLNEDVRWLFDSLGRTLRGWARYFRHGVSRKVFHSLDWYAWRRMTHWIRLKFSRRGNPLNWKQLRRGYCLPGSWKLAYDGLEFRGATTSDVPPPRATAGSRPPVPTT
ncbi:RNA-directed DNA polymerase [Phytomonospora endophytica]|uniref:RNA-directed DNA polymerase n=3 Tax=Phytomonospora endophytica TaxID=714109 RepID=A0A841FTP6_9ACTN|nr:RNA-directed DNA polymerase [Phytomonospora endophytica]